MSKKLAVAALAAVLVAPMLARASTPTFAYTRLTQQEFGGEPSIAVAPGDQDIYVVQPSLSNTEVFRSTDAGATFEKAANSKGTSGDSDVAVDADGTLYVSDLTPRVAVSISTDKGQTYRLARPGSATGSYDRQWIAADGHGHVVLAVRDTAAGKWIDWVSDDAFVTFSGPYTIGSSVSVGVGAVTIAPDGAVWTVYEANGYNRVAVSTDGGRKWTSRNIAFIQGSNLKASLFNQFVFPSIALDDAGNVYTAWSAFPKGVNNSATGFPAGIYVSVSTDKGVTWSAPSIVSAPGATSIFPWLAAGAPGKVDLVYYRSSDQLPQDLGTPVTTWDVVLAQNLNATVPTAAWTTSVVAPAVHTGSMCTSGTGCLGPQYQLGAPNAPGPIDRRALDFFEIAIDSAGAAFITYPKDHPLDPNAPLTFVNAQQDWWVAKQTGGQTIR